MSFRERLTDRLLALVGLDFDFTVDVQRKPLSEITDSLFVGRRPTVDDTASLKQVGITHIVSCLPERERGAMQFLSEDFRWLFVPLHDGIEEDIGRVFPEVFRFGTTEPVAATRSRLLVHCEVGVSRSATLAIAWVMKTDHMTFLDAYRKVRARRPEVLPNIGFASQLQRFEHALRPELRSTGQPSSLARYLREVCNVPVDVDQLQQALTRHDFDAAAAIREIFGDEIPRVVQGVRL